jgi:hypothetical protein
MCRQANNDARLVSGYIYEVHLPTGCIFYTALSGYAASQYKPDHPLYGRYALLRATDAPLSQRDAQRFLDDKGQGW